LDKSLIICEIFIIFSFYTLMKFRFYPFFRLFFKARPKTSKMPVIPDTTYIPISPMFLTIFGAKNTINTKKARENAINIWLKNRLILLSVFFIISPFYSIFTLDKTTILFTTRMTFTKTIHLIKQYLSCYGSI
jgi:hypothetical protein